jgi:predicted NAD-dependent protein-ADP-ribosyltransferase YbiA (DUF1768 family)
MILFYAAKDPYGFFSNFSRHPIRYMGRTWATSEHPFQAMKFYPHRPDLVDLVHMAPTPTEAARLGRDRSYPLRADWDGAPTIITLQHLNTMIEPDDGLYRPGVRAEPLLARTKDVFMYEICWAKVQQYPEIQKALEETGTKPIIENALHDPYWGWGASRVGENKLGRIFMAIRAELRAKAA